MRRAIRSRLFFIHAALAALFATTLTPAAAPASAGAGSDAAAPSSPAVGPMRAGGPTARSGSPAATADTLPVSPGTGTLFIGGYPNEIWVIDEAKAEIVDTIPLEIGLPRRLILSRDGARFYAADIHATTIEIVDTATRRTLETFTLSAGNRRVRINAFEPDPTHAYLVAVTREYVRQLDRYEIGPSKLVTIDLKTKEVTREIPWPDDTERDSASLLFSPDGRFLYLLGSEIIVFDTTDFTEVDRWDLSSLETGLGPMSLSYNGFGAIDAISDPEGRVLTTMTVEDPVQKRRLMGVARVDLAAKSLDFYTLGPAGGVNVALAPDGRRAFGIESEIGRYQFWAFDLEKRRVTRRQEFAGRPRMSLRTSTNGNVLYIYNAGNTIDLYDAATFELMKTLYLPGDVSTGLIVLPNAERP